MGATVQDDPWERDATDEGFDTHLLFCRARGDRSFGSWRTQCGSRVTPAQIDRAVKDGRLVKRWVECSESGMYSGYEYKFPGR